MSETLNLIHKVFAADEVNFTPGERSFVAWVSTEAVDHEGDVVVATGIDYQSVYMNNPVVMRVHDYGKWPLGQCEWLKVKRSPQWTGLYGKAVLDDDEETEKAWKKIKSRTVRAVSIGFVPPQDMQAGEWGPPTKDELKKNPHWKGARRIIRRSVMTEFSVCPIGMNPTALIEAVSKGLHKPSDASLEPPVNDDAPANPPPPQTAEELARSLSAAFTPEDLQHRYAAKGAVLGPLGCLAGSAVLDRLQMVLGNYLWSLLFNENDPPRRVTLAEAACDEFRDALVSALEALAPLDDVGKGLEAAADVVIKRFGPAKVAEAKAAAPTDDDDADDDEAEDAGPVRNGHFVKVHKGKHKGVVGKVKSVHRAGLVPDVDDDVPGSKADPGVRVCCYKAMGEGHVESSHHVGVKMAHVEKIDDLKPPKKKKGLEPEKLPPLAGKSDDRLKAEQLHGLRTALPAAVEREADRRLGVV